MKPDPSEAETVCLEDQAFLARRAAKEAALAGSKYPTDLLSSCCGARIDWKHATPMLCTRCDKPCEATTGEALKARLSFLEERNGILSELAASNAGEAHKARRERDEARTLAQRSTERLCEVTPPGAIGAFAARDMAIKDRDDWMSQCEEVERKLTQARAIMREANWSERASEALAAYHVFTKAATKKPQS